jgi:hypothetical protein
MATLGVSDGVVVETDVYRYVGQVRTGTQTFHGRGTRTWKNNGEKYEGEWKDGKKCGQGVLTYADGGRYEGEWKDDKASGQGVYTYADGWRYAREYTNDERSGRGRLWFPCGRVFDGACAGNRRLQGTSMEPDGSLFRAAFDCYEAERVPAGRIGSGRPPPGGSGGPPPAWEGQVELADGTGVAGVFRGMRLHEQALVTERGGAAYAVEYDGERTFAEGPVPVPPDID